MHTHINYVADMNVAP